MSKHNEAQLFAAVGTLMINSRHMLADSDEDQLISLHSVALNILAVSTLTIVDYCDTVQGKDRDEILSRLRAETKKGFDDVIDQMIEDAEGEAMSLAQAIIRRVMDNG